MYCMSDESNLYRQMQAGLESSIVEIG